MSAVRGDVEKFFRTLLLGDFEEDQSTSAQIVGGLISMIPILDQVMDARDITGTLYQINAHGGFKNADSNQLVNLGFAAFGAVPEVGSAFETVFKPIWKERRAAKGAVHSGLSAVERMLGMQKGGAIRWIRVELLGKWTARTSAAIGQVEAAMAAMIELTEFIANAQGWRDWMIPDPIQEMARDMLPSLKTLQGQIRAPLERGSSEIQAFLEDLLGEQAAAVMMGVGQRAAMGSATPGIRPKTGHNRADVKPKGKEPPRERQHKVGANDRTEAVKGKGPVQSAVRGTRKVFEDLKSRETALVGEHMVDYHELKRLGGSWTHDQLKSTWSPDSIKKVNADRRPVSLHLKDLPKVTLRGMDSVWEKDKSFTIVEAKARTNSYSAIALGKKKVARGELPDVKSLPPDRMLLHYLLGQSGAKQGVPLTQMSKMWVSRVYRAEKLKKEARNAMETYKYDRRVVFVTFESEGAVDHAQALLDINAAKSAEDVHHHTDHGMTRTWLADDIDAVDTARQVALDLQRRRPQQTTATGTGGSEPTKATKQPPSGRRRFR